MAGRNSQVARTLRILHLLDLNPQGFTVTELCRQLNDRAHEVGKRTVYRDLEALQKAGFPLSCEAGGGDAQKWSLARSVRVNDYLALDMHELSALYLARSALKPLEGTVFQEAINSVFSKIEKHLGSKAVEHLAGLGREMAFEPGPRWGLDVKADTLDTLGAACREEQVLRIDYEPVNGNGRRWREVGAHCLYFARGSLYLLAEDLGDGKVKTFSVPRIQAAELTDRDYTGSKVDPDEYFASSFGIFRGGAPVAVTLRFSAKVAGFVRERRWHASQRVVARDGGAIDLHLEVALTPDLVQWVLGFGAGVTVLGPGELKDQVLAAARDLLTHYSVGHGGNSGAA